MGKRKEFEGLVTSDKMNKTRVVKVTRFGKHGKYSRTMKTNKKFKAHDENNEAKTGDVVKIVETKPLSKDKRFRIAKIVKKAEVLHVHVKEEIQ
ncbi:MAG: 30S ribosomal protein S17 [Candidatus Omnitrophica bacterium]|nr:30S ribosomal protein S17 [Candidatus Omnitrophota bacterium]